MNRRPILVASMIYKHYQVGNERLEVLKGLSLKVYEGEMIGIFGPSGSGKSTLLHILGTLDRPTRGRVTLDGVDYNSMSDKELSAFRNKYIGFVFQFHHLLHEFTTLENVAIPLLIAGFDEEAAKMRALQLLKAVGLDKRAHHKPDELSGGERQRAAVARALANNPRIVLADEPTGNLDRINALALMNLFKHINRENGTTILVVTHNEELRRFFHRCFKLTDGILKPIT
ncbi:MAG: lipoprotein-releasing system ATP-binding protein LolD [Candidatus Hydrothermota bacterium]|nr:MAG: lipoprotein-releasing system ATP-binding protein LolD [Candidatus Hydrothermae bacterium]